MNYRLARWFARAAASLILWVGGLVVVLTVLVWPWTVLPEYTSALLLLVMYGIGAVIGALQMVSIGVVYALLAALHAYLDALCPAPSDASPPVNAPVSAPTPEIDPRARVRAHIAQQRRQERAIKPSNTPPP